MTIPNKIAGVPAHSQAIDQVMVQAINSKRLVAFMVDSQPEPPAAYRALAYSFDRYVLMAYLGTTDSTVMQRL